MIYKIYSIKDEKTGFTSLSIEQNEATALRSFKYAIEHGTIMKDNPSDYSLWYFGEYDTEKGVISNVNNSATKVIDAISLVYKNQNMEVA